MIREIKTSKFEGLAVLVPEDGFNFSIYKADDMQAETSVECYLSPQVRYSVYLKYDSFDYDIIGKANELTETQCSEICCIENNGIMDIYRNYINHSDPLTDAVQSFKSLMDSLECYAQNPYSSILKPRISHFEPKNIGEVILDFIYKDIKELYLKAEENTGTWLILKRI